MKKVAYYTKIYFLIVSQYIKARMQYKTDFWVSTIGMLLQNLLGFFTLWVLFRSIPALAGWNYDELVFLYSFSLLSISPAQIVFDNIWSLRFHIQQGSFIRYYFKPINMMFYYMSEVVNIKGIAQFVFAVVLLVASSISLEVVWDIRTIVIFTGLLLSASFIMTSLLIMAASTAFWITNSYSVLAFFFRIRDYARYPVTIFTGFFRVFFTFVVPIAFVAFFPSQAVLRPAEAGWEVWLTPFFGIGLFALAYAVWNKGTHSWSGTGS
jgi:ABC-2 type transport system permease protein